MLGHSAHNSRSTNVAELIFSVVTAGPSAGADVL